MRTQDIQPTAFYPPTPAPLQAPYIPKDPRHSSQACLTVCQSGLSPGGQEETAHSVTVSVYPAKLGRSPGTWWAGSPSGLHPLHGTPAQTPIHSEESASMIKILTGWYLWIGDLYLLTSAAMLTFYFLFLFLFL